jgi:hypothetical protein
MNSVRGVIDTLTGTYYSLPASLAVLVLAVWMIVLCYGHLARVLGFAGQDTGKMPVAQVLTRACFIGPILAIVLFIARSPAAEMRFVAPSLAVLIASCGVMFNRWPRFTLVMAGVLAATSLLTGFTLNGLVSLAPVTLILLGLFIAVFFLLRVLNRPGRVAVALLVFITVSIWTYIAWPSYLNICRIEAIAAWSVPYGELADGWGVIRDQTEPDCTVAYTNTIQIYPLFGFDLRRHLVYAPTRPGLHRLDQLPRMQPVIGEDVPGEVARVMMEGSDKSTWIENLRRSGANYLFIAKQNLADPSKPAHPPELDYVSDPRFALMFENAAASVYRVNW